MTIDQQPVTRFETGEGRWIYSFPVRSFAQLVNNIYVVSDGASRFLVDTGSGMEESNQDLLAGFEAIRREFGEPVELAELEAILISHGHIDHFGGLPFIKEFSSAPVGAHPLDRRILSNYEERVVVASKRLGTFLVEAGVGGGHRENLMAMYLFAKGIYHSTPVDFSLEEGSVAPGGIEVIHVPGHCPGQVCLLVDDVLLTADHVLSYTTPHQAPESITNNMGLAHYLDSLGKITQVRGVRLALGGHEQPMENLGERVKEIQGVHEERLEQIWAICSEPKSINEISQELFGQVSSYHVLLALEEAGAHVEYLYQRGELAAANVEEIESQKQPVIRYQQA